jgi:3-hydroxybutyryl-CoA dehydrogenase
MGRGIAQAFAYAGHPVWLVDIKPRSDEDRARLARDALAEIDLSLQALSALGAFPDAARPAILSRIHFAGGDAAAAAIARAAVIFEGVPEVLEVKAEALAFACAHMAKDAVLASTTSTFLVSTLAGLVSQPERFLNAHWLNPAYLIPLVELSAHAATAQSSIVRLRALLEGIGKVPVLCAAAAGYIVPRLQALLMNEAARMIEQGVASAEDIDKATRYGFGIRYAAMGVVEFIDYGGNDILYYASRYLAGELGARYEPPPIVERYMHEGRIGLKTLRGFYDYAGVDPAAYRQEALSRLLTVLQREGLLRPPAS